MRPRFLVTAATTLIVTCLFSPAPVHAASNLLFILDSSGSMWGKLEGTAKMQTAKSALSKLVGDLPKDTKVGLMAYGHRVGNKEPSACADIELLMPVGKATPDDVVSWLERINPKGKTPIAGSLRQTPGAFIGLEKSNNNIVLISDGIETCDGDPCAVAGELAKSDINVRVHVVGFDISDKDREQLECIAKLGNGKYFPANSTEGFTKAVTEAVKVAQAETKPEPAPAPQPPKPVVYFEDNFDGEVLSEHWEVLKPDNDSYIVEDGKILIVAAYNGHLKVGNVPNIIRFVDPLPEGDWVATIKFSMPYQTGSEAPFLAIYEDKDNQLVAATYSNSYYEAVRGAQLHLGAWKRIRGRETSFSNKIWGGHSSIPFTVKQAPNPILLRITKKGRTYTPAYKLEGMEKAEWIEHDKLTVLRSKGNLAFGIFQTEKVNGETPMSIDWFKIETEK